MAARGRPPGRSIEQQLWGDGCDVVVGIDEVGRGAWAGPLTIGAVVVPRVRRITEVRDSKLLTERDRERLFHRIVGWAEAWSVASASQEECDELGMAEAQRLATRRALEGLADQGVRADAAISDGTWNFVSPLVPRVEMRVKADRHCLSVAAASIVAKVTRDREMRALAPHYPHWSFESNKGYPCPAHKAALQGYGPSAIHRRTWVFMDHYVPWTGVPRVLRDAQPTLF